MTASLFPVLPRRHAGILLESAAEYVGVLIAHRQGDVADQHIGFAQKLLGLLHPEGCQVIGRADIQLIPELHGQRHGAHLQVLRQRVHIQARIRKMILHIGNGLLYNIGILDSDALPVVYDHAACITEKLIEVLNVQALGKGENIIKIIKFRFVALPLHKQRVHEIVVQNTEGIQRSLFSVQPVADILNHSMGGFLVPIADGRFEPVQIVFIDQAGIILLRYIGKTDDFAVIQKQIVVKAVLASR